MTSAEAICVAGSGLFPFILLTSNLDECALLFFPLNFCRSDAGPRVCQLSNTFLSAIMILMACSLLRLPGQTHPDQRSSYMTRKTDKPTILSGLEASSASHRRRNRPNESSFLISEPCHSL